MKQKLFKKHTRGFTLIELLVVTTIIIILSAIGIVSYQNAGQNARNAKRKSDIETVRQALVLFKSDTGAYPLGLSFTAMLTDISGYVSNPLPVDPKDGQTACGDTTPTTCGYQFVGAGGTSFTLTAPLEGSDTPYIATNP